jgi:hypothetical protein
VSRVALAVLGGLGLAAALVWGCASSSQNMSHDWAHYEPDAGWARYVPGPSYEQKPMETAGGVVTPQMNTIVPVSPTINPTVSR